MLPDSPTLEQYLQAAEDIVVRGVAALSAAPDADDLETARVQFFGDRRGEILILQKALGTLPAEQRREAGRAFNEAKTKLSSALDERRTTLSRGAAKSLRMDLTMPGRHRWIG